MNLRAFGGYAETTVVGVNDRHWLVLQTELQADDKRIHVGRCDLHHTNSF